MSLDDAVIGLKAYKEIDQRMALLWNRVDEAILKPRTNIGNIELPRVMIDDVSPPKPILDTKANYNRVYLESQ